MATDSLGVRRRAARAARAARGRARGSRARSPRPALPDAADFDNVVVARHGRIGHRRRRAAGRRHRDAAGAGHRAQALPHARRSSAPRTLAFAVSYSGDTEETLEMARGALAAGARARRDLERRRAGAARAGVRVRCTCRAPTASRCRGSRSARSSRRCSSSCSAWACCPRRTRRSLRAQQQLATRRDQCRPDGRGRAQPGARAGAQHRPHDPDHLRQRRRSAASPRCAGSSRVNENAKAPAFWNVYPELDHNEICGWGQHGDVTRQVFTLVELRHGLEHPRLEPRFAVDHASSSKRRSHQVLDGRGRGRGAARAAPRPHATSATGRATTSRSTTTSTPARSTPSPS